MPQIKGHWKLHPIPACLHMSFSSAPASCFLGMGTLGVGMMILALGSLPPAQETHTENEAAGFAQVLHHYYVHLGSEPENGRYLFGCLCLCASQINSYKILKARKIKISCGGEFVKALWLKLSCIQVYPVRCIKGR